MCSLVNPFKLARLSLSTQPSALLEFHFPHKTRIVRMSSSHPVGLARMQLGRANHCCTQVVIHSLAGGGKRARARVVSHAARRRHGLRIDLLSSRAILKLGILPGITSPLQDGHH